jgi:hypothetical protein
MRGEIVAKEGYGFLGIGRYRCDVYVRVAFTQKQLEVINTYDLEDKRVYERKARYELDRDGNKIAIDASLHIKDLLDYHERFHSPQEAKHFLAELREKLKDLKDYLDRSAAPIKIGRFKI